MVRHAGGPVDGAVADDDGHSPGELEDRHRPVDADVEHRVVGFDVRVGETHGGALGAPDEVPTGTEADRRRRSAGPATWTTVTTAAGAAFVGAGSTRRRFDGLPVRTRVRASVVAGSTLDAVDRHTGGRVDADGPGQLAHRGRARVRPQLDGDPVRSGHHEARQVDRDARPTCGSVGHPRAERFSRRGVSAVSGL